LSEVEKSTLIQFMIANNIFLAHNKPSSIRATSGLNDAIHKIYIE